MSGKCVPIHFRLGRRSSLPVAGVRAARLLRRRMRGRLFPVCGFGLDALSFNLFHLAFFRRGAAAGLLCVSSCFLLFGFSSPFLFSLLGGAADPFAGGQARGRSGRSFQDGSLSFRFCPSPHSYTRIHSSLAQSVEHAAVNRRVVGSSPTGGAIIKSIRTYFDCIVMCVWIGDDKRITLFFCTRKSLGICPRLFLIFVSPVPCKASRRPRRGWRSAPA